MKRAVNLLGSSALAFGLALVLAACGAGEETRAPTTTVQNVAAPTETSTIEDVGSLDDEDEDEGDENGKPGKKNEKDPVKRHGYANGHDKSDEQGNED
jgi:hypothetical protein